MRYLPLAFVCCIGEDVTDGDLEACGLAAESQACDDCSNGPMTCTFGATAATENSCGDCHARAALYQALCDAGVEASAEEIEADTVCEPAT